MAQRLPFYRLKRKNATALLTWFWCLCSLYITAQPTPVEINLPEKPLGAYLDRPGDLYLQFRDGIKKFDARGKLLQEFKPAQPLTQFEPRDGSRLFEFSSATGRWGFVPFGTDPRTSVPEEYAIEPDWVCSAGDNGLWILDKADYTLKRINLRKGIVEFEFTLPETLRQKTVQAMREYQGFLFIATASHLHMFGTLGRLLKTIELSQPDFDFLGEEVYYRQGNRLQFYNLFDGTQHDEELDPRILFIRLTDEIRYMVYANRVHILPVK